MQKPTALTGNRLLALCKLLFKQSFLPVEAYILYPYVYFLLAFLTPQVKVASPSHFLVFPENARLSTYRLTLRT